MSCPDRSSPAARCKGQLSGACSSLASQTLLAAALAGLLGVASVGCDDTEAPGQRTSSKEDPGMTAEKFKAMCDEKGGSLETHPHCGGANSCKGFSYDQTTHTFTEHTCKGLNTCTGFSCVLP